MRTITIGEWIDRIVESVSEISQSGGLSVPALDELRDSITQFAESIRDQQQQEDADQS